MYKFLLVFFITMARPVLYRGSFELQSAARRHRCSGDVKVYNFHTPLVSCLDTIFCIRIRLKMFKVTILHSISLLHINVSLMSRKLYTVGRAEINDISKIQHIASANKKVDHFWKTGVIFQSCLSVRPNIHDDFVFKLWFFLNSFKITATLLFFLNL